MGKSADAFRTISEVAEWLDVPAHVLRFWESKFTHIKPVKRAGGRRYYRPSDMMLIGGIKRLLHDEGMTIKGVQKLLREKGIQHVAGHSQPLDELTAAEVHDGATEPGNGSSPARGVQGADPGHEGELAATSRPAPGAVKHEAAKAVPGFSRTPEPEPAEGPPEDTHPESQTQLHDPAKAPASAAEPEQAQVRAPAIMQPDLPEDPADDIAAPPGILSLISTLSHPLPAATLAKMETLLRRLKELTESKAGGGGTGH